MSIPVYNLGQSPHTAQKKSKRGEANPHQNFYHLFEWSWDLDSGPGQHHVKKSTCEHGKISNREKGEANPHREKRETVASPWIASCGRGGWQGRWLEKIIRRRNEWSRGDALAVD
jgi:hypothetical protein